MADYNKARATAERLIKKFGTSAVLRCVVSVEGAKKWESATVERDFPLHAVIFADDGETFVNHNIQGNTRIALLSPMTELTNVSIGDKLILPRETVEVLKVKSLNPDTTGAILWTLLVR